MFSVRSSWSNDPIDHMSIKKSSKSSRGVSQPSGIWGLTSQIGWNGGGFVNFLSSVSMLIASFGTEWGYFCSLHTHPPLWRPLPPPLLFLDPRVLPRPPQPLPHSFISTLRRSTSQNRLWRFIRVFWIRVVDMLYFHVDFFITTLLTFLFIYTLNTRRWVCRYQLWGTVPR